MHSFLLCVLHCTHLLHPVISALLGNNDPTTSPPFRRPLVWFLLAACHHELRACQQVASHCSSVRINVVAVKHAHWCFAMRDEVFASRVSFVVFTLTLPYYHCVCCARSAMPCRTCAVFVFCMPYADVHPAGCSSLHTSCEGTHASVWYTLRQRSSTLQRPLESPTPQAYPDHHACTALETPLHISLAIYNACCASHINTLQIFFTICIASPASHILNNPHRC